MMKQETCLLLIDELSNAHTYEETIWTTMRFHLEGNQKAHL
jgi:hypothetical protein